MAAGVEIAAAGGVIVSLDAADDWFPDPGPLADLVNAETGLAARFRQGLADAHAAPPLLYRTACHSGHGRQMVMTPSSSRMRPCQPRALERPASRDHQQAAGGKILHASRAAERRTKPQEQTVRAATPPSVMQVPMRADEHHH